MVVRRFLAFVVGFGCAALAGGVAPVPALPPPLPVAAAGERLDCPGPPSPRAAPDRRLWTDAPSLRPVRWLARQIRAPGGSLEAGCARAELDELSRCRMGALDQFFAALDGTATGGRAAVVVFGNSLIASDGITGMLRERLVERFGGAGRGMVLADRMAWYGPRHRTAQRAWGWQTENIAGLSAPATPPGLSGVNHVSDGGAGSSFDLLPGERLADVFWFDVRGSPDLWWRVDDGHWAPFPRTTEGPRMARVELPADAGRFELKALAAGAVVHGVALEGRSGGVVLDVFGVPSADAALWLEADPVGFGQELAARRPDLVVMMLGGNEAKRLAWGSATRDRTEESLTRLLHRTRAAAPSASCLVVGPIDQVVGPRDGGEDPFRPRPQLQAVIDIERRVALAEGCAFFDLYQAMGGKDSLRRMAEAGQVHDDLTHPRDRGLDLLGLLLADALLAAYASPDWAPAPPPLALVSP